MELSKETLSLIKNFASINGSLLLKKGNKLTTIAEGKNVVADVTIKETFPVDFGIYDLNEFLSVISLFPTTDLEFTEKFVLVSDGGKSKIKYFAAGEGIVKGAPATIKFPSADITFELKAADLAMILRTSSALKSSDVAIVGIDGELRVVVADKANDTSNAYEVVLGKTDEEFKANLKVENLKMLPGDYKVSLSKKRISKFESTSTDLTYFVAVEGDSTF